MTRMDGVRLRDMYEVARQLLAEHKLCPDAVTFSLNERGFVDNTVACRGAFMTKRVRVVDESPFERHIAEDDPARGQSPGADEQERSVACSVDCIHSGEEDR